MIRTVSDLKRALDAYPDDLPVCIYSHRLDEYRTPIVMEYEGDDCVTIEPRHVRSDLKRILTPKARDHLQDLRAQADAFAQLPAVKMTREETMAFLDAAPVRYATVEERTARAARVDRQRLNDAARNYPGEDDEYDHDEFRKLCDRLNAASASGTFINLSNLTDDEYRARLRALRTDD